MCCLYGGACTTTLDPGRPLTPFVVLRPARRLIYAWSILATPLYINLFQIVSSVPGHGKADAWGGGLA